MSVGYQRFESVDLTGTSDSYAKLNNNPQFHEVDRLFEDRLRQFIDKNGGYKDLNLPKFYDRGRIDKKKQHDDDQIYIGLQVYSVPNLQRPLFKEVIPEKLSEFKSSSKGDSFGPGWATFWFRITFKISQSWIDAKQQILFEWDCGNEGLIYSKEGVPQQALTGGGERTEFILPESWYIDGEEHVFYLEMACNGMSGGVNGGSRFSLSKADLVLPNVEARALHYDFWILSDAARELSATSWQKHKARNLCNEIMNAFDPNDEATINKCRFLAKSFLGKDIDSAKVYDKKVKKIDVYAVGNCHIDTAWLWPFAETKRKVVRSWTSQINLMERYPEYKFVASQAQQFQWLKKYHPEIFSKVKAKISETQFFPIGGSWVENDTNLPSGESLSRQFLLGQRFFLDNFGFKSDTYWLPDTFGYSSQIPQLCRLADMPTFLTQKLSWNNINRFPNTTFNWVAIDGSQVLCHMPPDNTYTASADFGDVKRSLAQHTNLGTDQSGLLLYGKGDGGGGPTPEMLEKLRRCRGLTNTVDSDLPVVQVGPSIEEFYENILKTTNNGKTLPSWKGELYLEYHRGTYTTQAEVKKFMRSTEFLLHDLEYLATLASVQYPDDYSYPLDTLHEIWENTCLCQFHDVLPGSSIEMVYKDEVKPMLRKNLQKLGNLIEEIFDIFKEKQQVKQGSTSNGNVVCINSLPFPRSGLFEISNERYASLSLDIKNIQTGYKNDKNLVYLESASDSYHIMKPIANRIKNGAQISYNEKDKTYILSNSKLKATINSNGVITSLVDLANGEREVISLSDSGRNTRGGNQFVVFDDQPLNFPAWDTELYSLDKYKYLENPTKIEIVSEGPLRASLKVKHSIGAESWISTTISLDAVNDEAENDSGVSFLVFENEVEWHETYKFLKVEFPVDINSDFASYETQFGLTKRATHFNTSWEAAKFEVCSHKFADYSDFNYGVSILNDSKYGFSIHGNLMRLSLLRSPKSPDATADMGHHEFKYALYPHKGSLGVDTVRAGYIFNDRLSSLKKDESIFTQGLDSDIFPQLVEITGDSNLILSNVKRGEDDEGISSVETNLQKKFVGSKTIILRVYESLGGKSKGFINVDLPIEKVFKVNLLEEELEEIDVVEGKDGKNGFDITLRGFEIASYRVVFSN
ncbi:hypothetical protein PACTADRAFT_52017 [Pachysolen tannophilus NRRL Y-2460]|uniref:Alpha-mannosidase n=1 Tax=Pachysolen tannophilus NRRL Y-2460 TaxID=669874 RepID=A0A1E4TNY7_PACTA|nr:hypothetical protein PACTADRAFT_52017 [Pachysolen tannophilus NRRL Y-2460]